MGACCTQVVHRKNNKNNTLRNADENPPLPKSEAKAKESYEGKQAKEVVKDMEITDMLIAVKTQNFQLIEAICIRFKLEGVSEVRGLIGEFELLQKDKFQLHNWNLVQLSIAFNDLKSFRFFTKSLECHLKINLRAPPISHFSKIKDSQPQQVECFALLMAINNKNLEVFQFLWEDLKYLWDSYHLQYIIEEVGNQRFQEALTFVLRSPTTHDIFNSMRMQDKVHFLTELIVRKQTKRQMEVKETMKIELSEKPYATVAVFVLLQDPKGFHKNKHNLERCLQHMELNEFAVLNYTYDQFQDLVDKQIDSLEQNQEAPDIREFGATLRKKVKDFQQALHNLKGPLSTQVEYEQALKDQLFQLAQNGDENGFKQLVQAADIRVFKRKRLPISKLTASFQINPYMSFTPLLVAVQNKHLPLVKFMMEQMRVGLRQCLCLTQKDDQEDFMDETEECQVYAVLCAFANQDEPMVKYLWETFCSYLWTERHFEPLIRYLIEAKRVEGIRLLMKSHMTHQMVKCLGSDERSFFIDNLIGDIFEIQDEQVRTTLKEELTEAPYAGLFIVYIVQNFDYMNDDLIPYFEKAAKNLYLLELKLLARSNSNLFGQFILEIKFKRQEDAIKKACMMFVERLREVEQFKKLIESGDEESVSNGVEEVRMLKLDITDSPEQFYPDLIKFSVTGNVKQIEKLVEQQQLTAQDIYDLRGFRVKAYASSGEILSTRMWNPVMYAIFFKQIKVVAYFSEILHVDLRLACERPDTTNEYIDEKVFVRDLLQGFDSLCLFLLVAQSKDVAMLGYLFDKQAETMQMNEWELFALIKMYNVLGWVEGLLFLINSETTSFMFNLSCKDFKLFLVHYLLSASVLETDHINENKNEEVVKEIKLKMAKFPFSSVSWLYIEPDGKNNYVIKELTENFDIASINILSQSGQLEEVKKESVCLKPKLAINLLDDIKDLQEKEEMINQHKQERSQAERLSEHQQVFIRKIEEQSGNIIGRHVLEDTSDQIVTEVLEKASEEEGKGEQQELKQVLDIMAKAKVSFPSFVKGYSKAFALSRKNKHYASLEFDQLNLIQWALFYDKLSILQHYFQKSSSMALLGMAMRNQSNPFTYDFSDGKGRDVSLQISNIGAAICVVNKSLACWKFILGKKMWLFTVPEVFDLLKLITAEKWVEGFEPFKPYVEAAFSKSSISTRQRVTVELCDIKGDVVKEAYSIPRLNMFLEWMTENGHEVLKAYKLVGEVLKKQINGKEKHLKRLQFLNRHQEKKKHKDKAVEQQPKNGVIDEQNHADLNEIYLENL